MTAAGFSVDLDKPLVFQVGSLGEDYDKWVHVPIVSKKGPRFFGNDYLEMLTKTKWWVIPMVWLPVVCMLVLRSVSMGLETSHVAMMLVFGLFIWTLMEYMLHRFLFHVKTTSYWANTAHYLLHGCHHKHPMDALRLVFPPAATAILCVPFWSIVRILSTPSVAPVVFAGILSGYVMYDLTHYYLHHGKPIEGYFHSLKRYHLNHHFKLQSLGFGITSKLWDIVFGTLLQSLKLRRHQ